MNPLIPSASDILLAVTVIAHGVLAGAALLALGRSRRCSAVAALLALFVPVVGPTVVLIGTARAEKPQQRRQR